PHLPRRPGAGPPRAVRTGAVAQRPGRDRADPLRTGPQGRYLADRGHGLEHRPVEHLRLSDNIRQGLFNPPTTDDQKKALTSLENLLAIIDGWVDVVVYEACAHLPGRDQIREALRRRRATAGPAEKTFSTLVGLQFNPRRLRDAAALF